MRCAFIVKSDVDQTAFITGGSSGMGKEIAKVLASQGTFIFTAKPSYLLSQVLISPSLLAVKKGWTRQEKKYLPLGSITRSR